MNELAIPLLPDSRVPLYEQIYRHIRREVEAGNIRPGERLPSSRKLSEYLQVSRTTVDQAYGQLVAEGYLRSAACKGYYACEIESAVMSRVPAQFSERKRENLKTYRYDFSVNGIESGGFPHNIWNKLSRQILSGNTEELFLLGDSRGEEGLRRALAAYLHHARGVMCSPDQIIVGAGNDYLLMLLSIILGKKCKIGMENPTYISAAQCFRQLGHVVQVVNHDEEGMLPGHLEEQEIDMVYVMPSHQFPVGSIMPISRRMQLLSWASKAQGRFIIEDDYDSEFRYRGKPIPALQGSDMHDRVIYLGTFSKSLAPAIRVSYMVLPGCLLGAYEERAVDFSNTVSRVDQKILEEFLIQGAFERHLNRRRLVYRAKHDILLEELGKWGQSIEVSGEYAGVHLVVRIRKKMSEQEIVRRAEEAGVLVHGISEYCVEETEEPKDSFPTVILGYASIEKEDIRDAACCLKRAWEL